MFHDLLEKLNSPGAIVYAVGENDFGEKVEGYYTLTTCNRGDWERSLWTRLKSSEQPVALGYWAEYLSGESMSEMATVDLYYRGVVLG